MQNNNDIYFDSFGVEHIPKETKAFINAHIKAYIIKVIIIIIIIIIIITKQQIFSEYKHLIQ